MAHNDAQPLLPALAPLALTLLLLIAYLDEQQYVQYFGLPLAVLLSQYQHVQQAASHPLTQLGQTSLQLGHGVHSALAILHHLREQQGEGADTYFGFRSAQRPLQDSRLASGEASLHYELTKSCSGRRVKGIGNIRCYKHKLPDSRLGG